MKKKIFFGTDGIRGKVSEIPITPEFFFKLAKSMNVFLGKKNNKKVLIGHDTRESGEILQNSLLEAFNSDGFDCNLLGVVSTPIVSYLTKHNCIDFGIMISASHNQYYDNGIKVFKNNGEKLSDSEELILEEILINCSYKYHSILRNISGKKEVNFKKYYDEILSMLPPNFNLSNTKIVVDCANGSLFKIAPEVFLKIGLNIVVINNEPNGRNINKSCGALYPEFLSQAVLDNNADIGIAFDGDGDRLIMCDQKGKIIDGDKIMAIMCKSMMKEKKLTVNAVVGTHMSNIGLDDFLRQYGINLLRADVGDRYVVQMMKLHNCNFGGEQSGHFIFSDFSFTGDALLSALKILTVLETENKSINELLINYQTYPQVLVNLKTSKDPECVINDKTLKKYLDEIKSKNSKDQPMVLVRKSGTEKLIRVMVQSKSEKQTNFIIQNIINIIFDADQLCQKVQ